MRKFLICLVAGLFLAFAILAGRGQVGTAAAVLVAGFLVGASLTAIPSDAEREAARQRQRAAQHPEPLTRIY